MTQVKQSRATVFQDEGQLIIEIPPDPKADSILREIALTILFAALAVQFVHNVPPRAMLLSWTIAVIFLSFLILLCVLAMLRLIWRAFGYEEITLRAGVLSVMRRVHIFALGRVYSVKKLRDLHVTVNGLVSAIWASQIYRITSGSLAFRYEGRMHRIADRLNRADAQALLQIFRDSLPAGNWTPVLGLG